MTTSFWNVALSAGRITIGIVFLLITGWLCILNVMKARSGKGNTVLETLKFLVGCLLVFTLLRPEFVKLSRRSEQPLVAILCDASGSMRTRDVVAADDQALERIEWIRDQRQKTFWAPLEKTYQVIVDDFSTPPDPEQGVQDPGTDLNQALHDVLDNYDNLRAVVLLSDGDWNQGDSPVSAATKLSLRGIPVFPVVVGSDKYLPDLDLQSVAAPAYGLMDEHISLPFTIQSRLPRDVRTSVTLHGPAGIAASKTITIPAMAQYQDSVLLVPRRQGEHRFTLKLPVEKNEIFKNNNEKDFRISLRHEILKVLVVESTPRWEYRFLHNALSRDPGVEVHCLLLHPGMTPGEGRNYIASFPDSQEKLSRYDVVFLGDVGIGDDELKPAQVDLLKGLVEKQGSGLVFLPGSRGRHASLVTTSLGDLMPVVLDKSRPQGHRFPMESKLSLTARGKDHLLTMLASDPTRNYSVWKQLPGAYWHAPVIRAKPGTSVLAVHASARNQHGRLPLLVTRPWGNGKVLFMGTDNAWRWRRGVEDTYHYRFWGQVVRWMAHQRHLAHREGIRFFFSPESPKRDTTVFLHATVFDASGFLLKEGTVRAAITSESGSMQSIELSPEGEGWGVFTGTFTPREGGRYEIDVNCDEAERRLKTELIVSSPKRERIGRPARTSVLGEIAQITHGHSGTTTSIDEVIRQIQILPEFKPQEERFRLWCHPIWAGFIILLLIAYWTGRKLMGMI